MTRTSSLTKLYAPTTAAMLAFVASCAGHESNAEDVEAVDDTSQAATTQLSTWRTFLNHDGDVYSIEGYSGTWSKIGRPTSYAVVGPPTVVSHTNGSYDLFVADDNNGFWHAETQGGGPPSQWEDWSGNLWRPLSATTAGPGTMHVYGMLLDYIVERTRDRGFDTGWRMVRVTPDGELLRGKIAVVNTGSKDEVLVTDGKLRLWYGTSYDAVNFTWKEVTTPPGVWPDYYRSFDMASHTPETWDGFYPDGAGNIWHIYKTADGTIGWVFEGLVNGSLPASKLGVFAKDGHLILSAVIGNSLAIWTREWTRDGGWAPWRSTHPGNATTEQTDVAGW